jgi:hypothetical protein
MLTKIAAIGTAKRMEESVNLSVAVTNSVVNRHKSGEVAALNMVVAAVIVVVILVISIAMAMKYAKKGDQGAEESSRSACENDIANGKCEPGNDGQTACRQTKHISYIVCPQGYYCCEKQT